MPGVLVIDDDRSVVPLIRSACKQVGESRSIAAETAEEGLELLKAHPPDVLLLDVHAAGHHRPRAVRPRPQDRRAGAGHLHDGQRRKRHRHRGHEARRPRLPDEAARRRPRPGTSSSRPSKSAG